MAELLNYRASNSAVYYNPPKRFVLSRLVIGFVGASCVTAALALAYSNVLPGLRSLPLRAGTSLAFAVATGVIGGTSVRFAKLHASLHAAVMGAVVSLEAGYLMWLFWVHRLFRKFHPPISLWFMISHPKWLYLVIKMVGAGGSWTYQANMVRGMPLLLLWSGEAGLLLGFGVMLPIRMILKDKPTCECGAQCKPTPRLPRFAVNRQDEFVASIESRDFAAIASHEAPDHEDAPEISLRLLSCPRCGKTHVLTVNRIAWHVGVDKRATVQTTPLVNQLLISAEAADEIQSIGRKITEHREAAMKAEPADNAQKQP